MSFAFKKILIHENINWKEKAVLFSVAYYRFQLFEKCVMKAKIQLIIIKII